MAKAGKSKPTKSTSKASKSTTRAASKPKKSVSAAPKTGASKKAPVSSVHRVNEVTEFSKIVTAILFVSIPLITLFIGMNYGRDTQKVEDTYSEAAEMMMKSDTPAIGTEEAEMIEEAAE